MPKRILQNNTMKLTDTQKNTVLEFVGKGQMVLVGQYFGSKIEHVTWEAREAQGMTPGRSAGSMTFAVHTVIVGGQGNVQAHSVRVAVPKSVDWEKTKAQEWTDRNAQKASPALPEGATVCCVMSSFWTDKGALSEEAQLVVVL